MKRVSRVSRANSVIRGTRGGEGKACGSPARWGRDVGEQHDRGMKAQGKQRQRCKTSKVVQGARRTRWERCAASLQRWGGGRKSRVIRSAHEPSLGTLDFLTGLTQKGFTLYPGQCPLHTLPASHALHSTCTSQHCPNLSTSHALHCSVLHPTAPSPHLPAIRPSQAECTALHRTQGPPPSYPPNSAQLHLQTISSSHALHTAPGASCLRRMGTWPKVPAPLHPPTHPPTLPRHMHCIPHSTAPSHPPSITPSHRLTCTPPHLV